MTSPFQLLADLHDALMLTGEYSPETSVGSLIDSSAEFKRASDFLVANQHMKAKEVVADQFCETCGLGKDDPSAAYCSSAFHLPPSAKVYWPPADQSPADGVELCEDEGCPHHGIEHVCIEHKPDDIEQQLMQALRDNEVLRAQLAAIRNTPQAIEAGEVERPSIPREPTPEMLMAGRKQTFADMTGAHCGPSAENTWKAMYDAALSTQGEGR